MAKRRSKKLLEADKFRARVLSLKARHDVDWRPYEEKWLLDEANRRADYIYTDRERKVLNRLCAAATLFTHYSGYSVVELVKMTYQFRAELQYSDEEFLEPHFRMGTTALSVRQIRYLASLYRTRESLQRDEAVEGVFRETWTEDTVLHAHDEDAWVNIPYPASA